MPKLETERETVQSSGEVAPEATPTPINGSGILSGIRARIGFRQRKSRKI